MWLEAMSTASVVASRTCFLVSLSNENIPARSQLSDYRSPCQAQYTWLQQYQHLVEWLTKPHRVDHDDGVVVGGVIL